MKIFKNRKLLIIISLVLVAAIAVFVIFQGKNNKASATTSEQRTAVATKGELIVTLTGSGTVSPVNRKEMFVAIDGVVSENYLEEGKSFKEGDVLVKFNDSDAQLSVKQRENALNQKELSAISGNIKDGGLLVKAPFTGRITELNVKEGDEVQKDASLMTIVDERVLKAQVVFENAATAQFKGVHTVQIQLPDFMTSLSGKIDSISQDEDNVHAIIEIDNPGSLTSGNSAWAEAKTTSGVLTSTKGSLEFVKQEVIKAEVAGKISNLSVFKDLKAAEGKTLLSIAGDALPYTIEGEQLDLEQAQVELKLAQEKLEFYTIKAPFDGVAVSVADLDPGDSIESATSIAVLMDTSEMTFDLSIDELDISTVEIGQTVDVTADALKDEEIEGKVTAIAPEGVSTNGVTSYDVTVTIPGIENLKTGMNVDAVIRIVDKQNALLVPVEALQKRGGSYIVYSGAEPVKVTVGMHNETYIEITDGLSEGDVVVLPALVSNADSDTTSTKEQGGAGMMMPGMGGGGMPAGGMGGRMPAGGGRGN